MSAIQSQPYSHRLLVIRRDNIGDLVCTTPLLTALRLQFPHAWIGVWANSYNAPVLSGNPDINEVFAYTKAKHRNAKQSLLSIFWERWCWLWRLRQMQLDDIIIATTTPQPRLVRMARWLKPQRIIAFGSCGADIELPQDTNALHEVEDVMRIAQFYGFTAPARTLGCKVFSQHTTTTQTNLLGIHISARKPSQRWPADRFVDFLQALHTRNPALKFQLMWAPGTSNDPKHPGDDEKARKIIDELGPSFPITGQPTDTLPALIEKLAQCEVVFCADGGAMHLAAGLKRPILCLFGNSVTSRWYPWGVPYQLLQKKSLNVVDISINDTLNAFNELQDGIPAVDIEGPA